LLLFKILTKNPKQRIIRSKEILQNIPEPKIIKRNIETWLKKLKKKKLTKHQKKNKY
jgi:hypothetical protein